MLPLSLVRVCVCAVLRVCMCADATLTFWYYYYGSDIKTSTQFQVTMSATTDDGTTQNETIWTNSGTRARLSPTHLNF